MKKFKVISAIALAGLGALTLAACDEEKQQSLPTESNQTTPPIKDNSAEIAEKVLEYAKSDAISDITTYLENAKILAGVNDVEALSKELVAALDTAKNSINAATTVDVVDKAIKSFEEKVFEIINNYKTQNQTALQTAIKTAKDNLDDYAQNGFYLNTKDDGSVEKFRLYAASIFDTADSTEELTTMYTEANAMLLQLFETLLNASFIDITTPEELLAMESNKNYRLANDIDFDNYLLETLEGSNINFSGVFDGNGYTIKNWNVTNAVSNKKGLLFRTMTNKSVVRNVRFMNCSHVGAQEGIALITGEATNSTFKNLEFYGCTVDSKGKSYAGLLVGRKTINGITVDQITVKANSSTSGNYGGGLVGDARDMNKGDVSFTNLDIDLNMNVVNNTGGLLIGRSDGSKMGKTIVRNVRINANITGQSTKAGCLFDGASKIEDYLCENVLLSANCSDGITSDFYTGQKYGPTSANNIWFIEDKTNATNTSGVPQAIQSKDLNAEWYYNVLGLDKDIWVTESNGTVKLKGASSNVIVEAAELLKIEVFESRAKTYYYFEEAFTSENLVVLGTYKNPDGNILQANLSTVEVANLGSYKIDDSEFNNKKAGTYTINVIASKKFITDENPDDEIYGWIANGSYSVTVNMIEKLSVYDQEANRIFLKGESFDDTGLVVKAIFSNNSDSTDDNVESTMHNSEEKTFYNLDTSQFKSDTVGSYTIKVSATENGTAFSNEYVVEVVDAIDVTGLTEVSVTVDANAQSTTIDTENKTATFNSISKALDYLESLKLADSVAKIINLKNGKYEEKITVSIPNVSFVGESQDGVIIAYGAAAGHKYLDESKGNYGTDKSATVLVEADLFTAKNVTFVNSFDYNNDNSVSDKQALAIGVYADQAVFYNCSFKGYQDTLQTKEGRSYFYECYIEGNVDFIFGVDCTTYFNKCEIKSLNRESSSNGGYIVAPKTEEKYTYGFYFNECNFTAETGVVDGTVSIARPWGAKGTCVVMNSTLGKHISKLGYKDGNTNKINSRYEDMSGNLPVNANFKEYNNTGDAAITEAVEGCTMLTKEEADALIVLTNLYKADASLEFEAWDAQAVLDKLMK